MKIILLRSFIFLSFLSGTYKCAFSQAKVAVSAMSASKNIADNVTTSRSHSTLNAALKTTELNNTLKSQGPYTVFAPTNMAFKKLPKGTIDMLLKPQNKEALSNILKYHIISSKILSSTLIASIKQGGGTYKTETLQGAQLTFSMQGKDVLVADEKGGIGKVTIKDISQSNGVIHVVDTVLMP
jgi:uncharacterized surface protein with fasciclin (FAS1) repeats